MGRFFLQVILTTFLWWTCSSQDMREAPLFLLRTVVDGIDEILRELKGQNTKLATLEESQKTIEESMKETQMKLAVLEASQNETRDSLGQPREEYQECVTKEQAETIQNTSFTEHQEILSSLQQCYTKDQFSDFYNLLTTDECRTGIHECSKAAACTDEIISYRCSCLPGYSGDGFSCQDIDECSTGNLTCDADATCVNSPGSFRCECNTGYVGDGYTCEPKCVSPSAKIDGLGCVTPILTKMNWDDARDTCRATGSRLVEGIRKDHFRILYTLFGDSMSDHDMPWIGIRNAAWISSGDPVDTGLYHNSEPTGDGQECGHFHIKSSCLGLGDGFCVGERYSFCQIL